MRETKIMVLLGCILTLFSCQKEEINLDLIPYPSKVVSKGKMSNIKEIKTNALHFGISLPQGWKEVQNASNLSIDIEESIAPEGYELIIDFNSITIKCSYESGLKYAINTMAQLQELNGGKLPACTIIDQPKFAYRGMHLDVGRHLFAVEDIKRYIDYLAYYKFNKFHWHLTEDQGWRIEIKKYPLLQQVAAYRKETLVGHYNDQPHKFDAKKYGGYYTQEEAKEVVAYASSKGIEVIPEIEMPGHSQAALAAYPELGCGPGPYEVATLWGVFDDVYCPSEKTFTFLQDVIDEICTIFPSNYIHIGGDECPKIRWKESALCQSLIRKHNLKDEHGLQSYFIQRMEAYINSKGKKIIGWDEILEGGLAPNATVMSWRGEQGGIDAAMQDHDVVMTPTSYCYFDYYQSDRPQEPLAIGGYLPVSKVYNWNPIPDALPKEKHQYILGGQGNVWTEYMPDFDKVTYMALARMIVLSEVLWGKQEGTDYDVFQPRLFTHTQLWQDKGHHIANHLLDIPSKIFNESGHNYLDFSKGQGQVFYKQGLGDFAPIPNPKFILKNAGEYTFYRYHNGLKGAELKVQYKPHLATKATISISSQPNNKYQAIGPASIINGVYGSTTRYGDNEWLGFTEDSIIVDLTWAEPIAIKSLSIPTYHSPGQWIYSPSSITASIDNLDYALHPSQEGNIKTFTASLSSTMVTKLRLKVKNFGIIPDGQQGAGHLAWLFIDELRVE